MNMNYYREPFDGLNNPASYASPLVGYRKDMWEKLLELATEYATELEEIHIARGDLLCSCGQPITSADDIEAGGCEACQKECECAECGDGGAGYCAACAA